MSKLELVPIPKNRVNKIIIKGDWNDGDDITFIIPYREKYLSVLALLEEIFSDTDSLETVNGKKYALDIRTNFEKCFNRFIELNVVDESLRNKLLDDDSLSDYFSEFIPYESNSGLGSSSLKISIVKNGIDHKIKNSLSVDELFEKLLKENDLDELICKR